MVHRFDFHTHDDAAPESNEREGSDDIAESEGTDDAAKSEGKAVQGGKGSDGDEDPKADNDDDHHDWGQFKGKALESEDPLEGDDQLDFQVTLLQEDSDEEDSDNGEGENSSKAGSPDETDSSTSGSSKGLL